MEVEVRLLERGEIGAAARLLARAFAADPFIGHFLKGWRRRFAYPAFFAAALHDMFGLGAVYAAVHAGRLAGVAAWTPPSSGTPSGSTPLRARLNLAFLRVLYPRNAPRVLGGFERLQYHHPPVPHWYLAFVGLEPELQGKGIGRVLLAPVLAEADESATTCYLETPFPATHPFYRSLGFELTKELELVEGAPKPSSMTRKPAEGASPPAPN
jgi:GNAT superfamily N-acetyltransferase